MTALVWHPGSGTLPTMVTHPVAQVPCSLHGLQPAPTVWSGSDGVAVTTEDSGETIPRLFALVCLWVCLQRRSDERDIEEGISRSARQVGPALAWRI